MKQFGIEAILNALQNGGKPVGELGQQSLNLMQGTQGLDEAVQQSQLNSGATAPLENVDPALLNFLQQLTMFQGNVENGK